MTVDAPAWGDWTTLYDSVGQAPTMTRNDSDDGLAVTLTMDRMQLFLQSGPDAPFAGAIGLAGELPPIMPDEFPLTGFLLVVNGNLHRSLGSEAVVTCSIGHAAQTVEWAVASPEGIGGSVRSASGEEAFPDDAFLDAGFAVECFTRDFRPGGVGAPPFPPLPPVPVTVSLQARRRFVDESLDLTIIDLTVLMVR
jgi:hypothetical protein